MFGNKIRSHGELGAAIICTITLSKAVYSIRYTNNFFNTNAKRIFLKPSIYPMHARTTASLASQDSKPTPVQFTFGIRPINSAMAVDSLGSHLRISTSSRYSPLSLVLLGLTL